VQGGRKGGGFDGGGYSIGYCWEEVNLLVGDGEGRIALSRIKEFYY
jgi:hypothetical protein